MSGSGEFRHDPDSTVVWKPFCVLYVSGLNLRKIPDVFMRVMEGNCDAEFLGSDYKNENCVSEYKY